MASVPLTLPSAVVAALADGLFGDSLLFPIQWLWWAMLALGVTAA